MTGAPDPMAEIRVAFLQECDDLLEAATDGLQQMLDGTAPADTVHAVFRAIHSIKGGAGAFSLDDLVSLAHRFETVLDALRSGDYSPDESAMLLFLRCCDLLSDLVRAARDGSNSDATAIAEIETGLEALVDPATEDEVAVDEFEAIGLDLDLGLDDPAGDDEGGGNDGRWRIRFAPGRDLYRLGNEPLFLFRALGELGTLTVALEDREAPDLSDLDLATGCLSWRLDLDARVSEPEIAEIFEFVEDLAELEIMPRPAEADLLPDIGPIDMTETPASVAPVRVPDAPATSPMPASEKPPASPPASAKPTVRVDLDRIDRLVNLVGELVINQAMLSQSVAEAGLPTNSPVASGLEDFMQLTRDIQDGVMMIRAQPVKPLFHRMSRIVRETAAATGKIVRLKTEGETTEVDKTVIERLADPLTHMIRNAVDHGLETGERRQAAGKPDHGTVTLKAGHRSGRVVIEIADDGAGINREKVLRKAIDKGLVAPDAVLADAEIDNLLFMPGFSTVDEVSNLSGRGVGMDVVKSAIQDLGGRITIQSEAGLGTSLTISLPLTLAVLDGMVVNVASETLVVPLNTIVETITLTGAEIRALGPETHVVQVRGTFVPLLDLGTELGYRAPLTDYAGATVLLIAQEDGRRAALVVDYIQDQRQVVIKGLQDSYGHVPGVAAATILGDGRIALIIDPADVTLHARGCTGLPRALHAMGS